LHCRLVTCSIPAAWACMEARLPFFGSNVEGYFEAWLVGRVQRPKTQRWQGGCRGPWSTARLSGESRPLEQYEALLHRRDDIISSGASSNKKGVGCRWSERQVAKNRERPRGTLLFDISLSPCRLVNDGVSMIYDCSTRNCCRALLMTRSWPHDRWPGNRPEASGRGIHGIGLWSHTLLHLQLFVNCLDLGSGTCPSPAAGAIAPAVMSDFRCR